MVRKPATLKDVAALANVSRATAARALNSYGYVGDETAQKVTLIHEELKSLEMPARTMVFNVSDDALLAKLKQGTNIQFVAERVNGKLTVTQVK